MGDVAQILGVSKVPTSTGTAGIGSTATLPLAPPPPPSSHTIPRSIQNSSTILGNKTVLGILAGQAESQNAASSATLPPIVPSHNLPLHTVHKKKASGDSANPGSTAGSKSSTPPPSHANSNAAAATTTSYVKINNKHISTKRARSWVYAPFSNSARADGLLLHHWVRAGVEYPDYPYARFNVHLDELSYRNEVLEDTGIGGTGGSSASSSIPPHGNATSGAMNTGGKPATATSSSVGSVKGTANVNNNNNNSNGNDNGNNNNNTNNPNGRTEEEIKAAADAFYQQYLSNEDWTQAETDVLLELCRVYELRWPVIIDRWIGKFGPLNSKKVEDLQHRYYTVGYILNRMKVERAAKVEAENLAKAMAVANQNIVPSASVVGGASLPLSSRSASASASASALTSGATGVGPPMAGVGGATGAGAASSSSITGVGAVPLNSDSLRDNDTLQAEHTLVSAITSSSSTAIQSVVGENVKANLQPTIPAPNTGTSNQPTFDLEAERHRRKVLDIIWARTKEEELEEIELRNELKLVEAQIRKLKKSGGHIVAAAAAASSASTDAAAAAEGNNTVSGGTNASTTKGAASALKISNSSNLSSARGISSSRGTSPAVQSALGNATSASGATAAAGGGATEGAGAGSDAMANIRFTTTAPTPTPGTPYLQSGRQKQPSVGGRTGINKATLKRMDQVLHELNVSERPIPTKRVCDLYDHVRKGALMLLTLQKMMLKKESEVVSKRLRLEKMAGSVVQQREAAAAAASAAAAAAAANAASQAAAAAAAAKSAEKKSASSGTSSTKGSKSSSNSGGVSGSKSGGSGGATGGSGSSSTGKKGKGSSGKSSSSTKEKKTKKKSSSGESASGTTKKRKSSKKSKDKDGTSSSSGKGKSASPKTSSKSSASAKGGGTTSSSSTGASTSAKTSSAGGSSTVSGKATTSKTTGSKSSSSKGGTTSKTSKDNSKGKTSTSNSKSSATTNTAAAAPVSTATSSAARPASSSSRDADGKPAKKRAKKS